MSDYYRDMCVRLQHQVDELAQDRIERNATIEGQRKVIDAARALWETHEIQMYVGDDAVSGGHIGYCARRLGTELADSEGKTP